ncbi:DUF4949 domain-containing protein [Legionella sp. W05-934-2]|uniref:DUF4949 domain-containing protein n=1 Tax=Legionella sp. W05-934-2 TaxID=1198649 RepID=UPI0034621922
MKLFSKAATFVGAMALAATTFAGAHQADRCPGVEAIQAQGISMVLPIDFNLYIGMETSNYDTDNEWAFLIGPVESEDYDDAVGQANDSLKSLSGSPMPEEEEGVTFCEYNTGSDELAAIAITADDMLSTQKVKQLFRKKS